MNEEEFVAKAKILVYAHACNWFMAQGKRPTFFSEEIRTTWFACILGNWKGLFSIPTTDVMYFEVIFKPEHDGSDGPATFFIDVYKKIENVSIEDDMLMTLNDSSENISPLEKALRKLAVVPQKKPQIHIYDNPAPQSPRPYPRFRG